MKRGYIIANWKSNKTSDEVKKWFNTFRDLYLQKEDANLQQIEIVVCPTHIALPLAKNLRDEYKLPVKLGAQDISPFDSGAYTGEISASQLREYVEYVIIGHSERRKNFLEEDKILSEKVKKTMEKELIPIYCVQDEKTFIPKGITMVAYEPVWAIGTGKTDTPKNANGVLTTIKEKSSSDILIYGGSVKADNIKSFLKENCIDGVLVGGASLDAVSFWEMIANAATL